MRAWLALPLAAVALNLVALAHEVTLAALPLNDHVLHHGLIRRAAEALAAGDSVLDHWVGDWVLGFPVFQYYQHLPHLAVVALQRITGGDALVLLTLVNVLVVALFPLAMLVAMRWLGVPPRAAALAALAASLSSTPGLFGFDLGSYLWRGSGLYTQAWGMCLLPLAIAATHRAVAAGRGVALAALLLSATLLSHLVYGWIAAVSALVLAIVVPAGVGPARRLGRLGLALAGSAVAASYFLLPYALNHAWLNRSVWEPADKYDSYGHARVLEQLVTGQLLDAGRLPVLTALLGLGVVVAAVRRRPWERALLTLLLTWLLLYFGRPTWGVLLDLLPGARDMHFHRLIGGVHLAAIPLIGVGLDAVCGAVARAARGRRAPIAAAAAVLVLLLPAWVERARYVGENRRMVSESAAAFARQARDLAAVVASLERLQAEAPARVYAGLAGGWGGRFTIGHVPLYAFLNLKGFPMLGYAYHAMSPAGDVQYHFDERRRDHYDVFGVGYLVTPAGHPVPAFTEPVATHGALAIHRVRDVGYVGVVEEGGRGAGSREQRYHAGAQWLSTVPGPEPGRVLAERTERQGWSATVTTPHAAFALVKTAYHPWWRAEVDGVAAPTVALIPGFVAVPVAAGEHRVRVDYRPPRWKTWLAVLGPLALAALFIIERRAVVAIDRPLARLDAWIARRRGVARAAAPVLGVTALALVAGLPLLQNRLLSGHDAPKYPLRAALVWDALRHGEVFPRWAQPLAAGYGEPAPNFTPPLVSYLAAAVHGLGASLVTAVNLTSLAFLVVAALGMWRLAADVLGARAAPVAAAAYVFAPYLLLNLYVRADHSELAALALVPLLAWSVLRVRADPSALRVALAALVLGAFLLASAPATLVVAPLLAAGALGLAARRGRRALIATAGALALGGALAAFYALPAFAERDLVQTARAIGGWWDFRNHFVPPGQLVHSEWRYAYNDFPSTGRAMSFALGPVHWLAVAFALFALAARLERIPRRAALAALAVAGLGVFMTTEASRAVWEAVPILRYLQFPWRFLALAAAGTSLLCALPLAALTERRHAVAVGGSLIVALLVTGVPHARPAVFSILDDTALTSEAISGARLEVTSVAELRPATARRDPPEPASAIAAIVAGPARLGPMLAGNTRHTVTVEASGEAIVRLNVHAFPGWTVSVDGHPARVRVTEPEGLMEVTLPGGTHRIEAVFARTPVRLAADVLSLTALGAVVALAIVGVRRPVQ